MNLKFGFLLMLVVFLGAVFTLELIGGLPNGEKVSLRKTSIVDEVTIDVNNWAMAVTNQGSYAFFVSSGNAGAEFPKGSDNFIIFAAGFYVAAVKDPTQTDDALRYSVSHFEFAGDFTPGPILNGAVRNDVGELVQPGVPFDQLEFDNQSAADNRVFIIDKTRTGADWDEWPIADGAPAAADGKPLLVSDQDSWCVFNDADIGNHELEDTEIPGLGVQCELHTFAFTVGDLANLVFASITVTNKTDASLDSTYLGLWFDPDVGEAANDLIGVDTVYEFQSGKIVDNLAFAYNAADENTPTGKQYATGVDFFQGPLIDAPGSMADPTILTPDGWQKYSISQGGDPETGPFLADKKILDATAFTHYLNTADPRDPQSDKERYYYVSGLDQDGTIKLASEGFVEQDGDKFVFPGDPVLNIGLNASSSLPSGEDVRMMFGTGPFDLQPGVPTSIIFGIIGGEADDRLAAITSARERDLIAQATFNAAFASAESPVFPNTTVTPLDGKVVIQWDDVSEYAFDDFGVPEKLNIPGWILNDFQGYRIYRSLTGLDWTEIAEFDKKDGVTKLVTSSVGADDNGNQIELFSIVEIGTDNGLQYQFVDDDVTNGITYYYAVTAYDAQPFIPPSAARDLGTLESARDANLFTAVPSRPMADASFFDASVDVINHSGLATSAVVEVTVVDPAKVTGDDYKVEIFQLPATGDPDGSGPLAEMAISYIDKPDVTVSFLQLELGVDSLELTPTLRPGDFAWRLKNETTGQYVKFKKSDDPYTFYDVSGDGEFNFTDANFNGVPEDNETIIDDKRFDDREFSVNFVAIDANGVETGSTMAFEIIDGLMIRVLDPTPSIASASIEGIEGGVSTDDLWLRVAATGSDDVNAIPTNVPGASAGAGFLAEGEDASGVYDAVDWFHAFFADPAGASTHSEAEHLLTMSRNYRFVKGTSVQPFEIRFSRTQGSWVYSYEGSNSLKSYIGKAFKSNKPYAAPFTAWDVSDAANPRQVNAVIVGNAKNNSKSKWEPADDKSQAIFVMNSDYSFDDGLVAPVGGAVFDELLFGGVEPAYATNTSRSREKSDNYAFLGLADVMGIAYVGDNPNVAYVPVTGEVVTGSAIVDTFHVQLSPLWNADDFSTLLTEFTVAVNPITSLSTSDEYSFSTNANTVKDKKAQKQALKDIKTVPNPYYGYSAYQSGQFDKQLKFINLPSECTIRVFTVSGELVKTIVHNDRSDNNRQQEKLTSTAVFDIANVSPNETKLINESDIVQYGDLDGDGVSDTHTGIEVWDLTNLRGNFIASGMYIVHVDAPGIGEKILKTAVIMEREIIDGSVEQ